MGRDRIEGGGGAMFICGYVCFATHSSNNRVIQKLPASCAEVNQFSVVANIWGFLVSISNNSGCGDELKA